MKVETMHYRVRLYLQSLQHFEKPRQLIILLNAYKVLTMHMYCGRKLTASLSTNSKRLATWQEHSQRSIRTVKAIYGLNELEISNQPSILSTCFGIKMVDLQVIQGGGILL